MENIQVAVYRGSLIATVEAPASKAWRAAVSYVKGMAHAEGVEGGSGWEGARGVRGRFSFQRGAFTAVSLIRKAVR